MVATLTKNAPLIAFAAMALAGSTADAQQIIPFPTNVGTATFAAGVVTFTLDGDVLTHSAAAGVTGELTIASDSWSCEEEPIDTPLVTIAEVSTAAPSTIPAATTLDISDFRRFAGKRVNIGEECAVLVPTVGTTPFYGGAIGNYGSGLPQVNGVMFPTFIGAQNPGTATGQITLEIGDNTAQDVFVVGNIETQQAFIIGDTYTVYVSDGGCEATRDATLDFTGDAQAFTYNDDPTANSGAFIAAGIDGGVDDQTFRLDGFSVTKDVIADKAIRVHHLNPETNNDDEMVMCGFVSYLPRVRGYIVSFPTAANLLNVVGMATGTQRLLGQRATMHLHTATATTDDPVEFPDCSSANTVGHHVLVENTLGDGAFSDHFVAGGAGNGEGGVALESVLTYLTSADGISAINGVVSGYWTLEDVQFQALVMHTRQAGTALDLELRAGCANMNGVLVDEIEQGEAGPDGGNGLEGNGPTVEPINNGDGSTVALSASALIVAAVVNAFM